MRPQAPAAGALLPPAGLCAPPAAAGAGRCLALRAPCRSLQSVFPGRRRGLFRRGRFPLAVRRRRGLFRRLSPPPGGDAAVALRAGASTRRTWCWPLRPARSGAEMPKKAGPVAADPKGCVTIAIHAKPGSKQNAVTDVTAEAVSVAIAAPPSEGEANAELCRYLSKVLDLRKSDVVLDKGGKSREKVVKLLASTTPDEILEKLKKEVEKK
nr:UPF0235 protein C15orf40 homolog [Equus caballus]